MSNTATLGSLVTWARALAALPKGGPVSADLWRQFVNQGLSELHYILAETYEDWFEAEQTITLVSSQTDYPLEGTVYKPLSADYYTGSVYYNIPRFMLAERNNRQRAAGWIGYAPFNYIMRITGNVLRMQPAPSGTATVLLRYIPAFKPLENDNAPIHQAIPQGWEEMAAYSAAMRAAQLEGDPRAGEMKGLRDELGARFAAYATDRHAGEPNRVNARRSSRGRRLLYGW